MTRSRLARITAAWRAVFGDGDVLVVARGSAERVRVPLRVYLEHLDAAALTRLIIALRGSFAAAVRDAAVLSPAALLRRALDRGDGLVEHAEHELPDAFIADLVLHIPVNVGAGAADGALSFRRIDTRKGNRNAAQRHLHGLEGGGDVLDVGRTRAHRRSPVERHSIAASEVATA